MQREGEGPVPRLRGLFEERGEGVRDVYGFYPNIEQTICIRDRTVIKAVILKEVMLEMKHDMQIRVNLRLSLKVRRVAF